MDTAISASEAPMTELTAAMAEPPQMAVPTEMSVVVFLSSAIRRPAHQPSNSVAPMVAAANTEPLSPKRNTIGRFMPKPSSTTQICSSHLVTW